VSDVSETQETVFCVGGDTQSNVYHTDPDCQALQRAEHVLEYSRESVEINRDICRYCSGEAAQGQSDPDRSHYKSLLEGARS